MGAAATANSTQGSDAAALRLDYHVSSALWEASEAVEHDGCTHFGYGRAPKEQLIGLVWAPPAWALRANWHVLGVATAGGRWLPLAPAGSQVETRGLCSLRQCTSPRGPELALPVGLRQGRQRIRQDWRGNGTLRVGVLDRLWTARATIEGPQHLVRDVAGEVVAEAAVFQLALLQEPVAVLSDVLASVAPHHDALPLRRARHWPRAAVQHEVVVDHHSGVLRPVELAHEARVLTEAYPFRIRAAEVLELLVGDRRGAPLQLVVDDLGYVLLLIKFDDPMRVRLLESPLVVRTWGICVGAIRGVVVCPHGVRDVNTGEKVESLGICGAEVLSHADAIAHLRPH
mmetsp:Transcript_141461/g.394195  ORF Transcript_141461/g.394195 Transcript_141461/m.394195 type:complete len:343 (-) Transcript_141461:1641-2669(-)